MINDNARLFDSGRIVRLLFPFRFTYVKTLERMTQREKSRLEAAINNQYQRERKKQGCYQALLGLLLWIGVLIFVYYCAKTLQP